MQKPVVPPEKIPPAPVLSPQQAVKSFKLPPGFRLELVASEPLVQDPVQIVFDPAEYPTEAVHALRQAETAANLAVPLDWGEYVLWFLAPRVKVSLDGKSDETWRGQFATAPNAGGKNVGGSGAHQYDRAPISYPPLTRTKSGRS